MKPLILLVFSLVAFAYVVHVVPRKAVAEPLSNAQFLRMSFDERVVWFRGAFDALGHIAYQSDKDSAVCIWRWLDARKIIRTEFLLEHFSNNPDQSPTTTLLIILKHDCGLQV